MRLSFFFSIKSEGLKFFFWEEGAVMVWEGFFVEAFFLENECFFL